MKILANNILRQLSISRRRLTTIEKRNPVYSSLTSSDLSFFERLLDKTRCITDASRLASFNTDWMKKYRGQSELVLLPRTTQEVSEILRYCNQRRLAVCPQGGNTGLVGGSVPVYDEIVLSTRLMNQVIRLDPDSSILRCQSGAILQVLDEYVAKNAGLMMPLDLGAKGSCHIGGNVATNAGGLRLLRYGSLKGLFYALNFNSSSRINSYHMKIGSKITLVELILPRIGKFLTQVKLFHLKS